MKNITKLIFFLILLCLIGCKHDNAILDLVDNTLVSKTNESEMNNVNDTKGGFVVDDLLDSIEMLGKTASEIGIPREIIDTKSKYLISTYLDGHIFGTEDYGILFFYDVTENVDDYVAKNIWIRIKKVGYDECKKQLTKRFGSPTDEGENPFVEIEGGAVRWAIYRLKEIEIRLSSASQRDFVEIDVRKPGD